MGNRHKQKKRHAKQTEQLQQQNNSVITGRTYGGGVITDDIDEEQNSPINNVNTNINAPNITLVDANNLNQLLSALSRFSGVVNLSDVQPTENTPPSQDNMQQFSVMLNALSSAFEKTISPGQSNQNPTASGSSDNRAFAPHASSSSALTTTAPQLISNDSIQTISPSNSIQTATTLSQWDCTSYLAPPNPLHYANNSNATQYSVYPNLPDARAHTAPTTQIVSIAPSYDLNSTFFSSVGQPVPRQSAGTQNTTATIQSNTYNILPIPTPAICSTKFHPPTYTHQPYQVANSFQSNVQPSLPAPHTFQPFLQSQQVNPRVFHPVKQPTAQNPHQSLATNAQASVTACASTAENEPSATLKQPAYMQPPMQHFVPPIPYMQPYIQPSMQHSLQPYQLLVPHQQAVRFPQIKITGKHTEHSFVQLESWFEGNGINSDEQKFMYLKMAIDGDTHMYVKSILDRPPQFNKYDSLKQAVLNVHTETEQRRMQSLISGVTLGDRRPSQMLAQMQDLYRGDMDHPIIRNLFLSRLPATARQIISGMMQYRQSNQPEPTIEQLAHWADSIIDGGEKGGINAISSVQPSELSALKNQVENLAKLVSNLSSNVTHAQQNTRPQQSADDDVCFFHRQYGKNKHANKKCLETCKLHQAWLAIQAKIAPNNASKNE